MKVIFIIFNYTHTHTEVSEKENRENEREVIFKEIIAMKFPKVMESMGPRLKEHFSAKIWAEKNKNKSIPAHSSKTINTQRKSNESY